MNAPSTPNSTPLAYLEGFTWFYGRKFLITPNVLIPRPETEDIITASKTLCRESPCKILDLGTGSGIIAITLALEIPKAIITATDISKAALKIAHQNATLHNISNQIQFIHSNLFQGSTLKNQKYNIIAANLPYVDQSWPWLDHQSLAHEPTIALFAPDHGLAIIKKFLTTANNHLKPNGHILLEADPSQHAQIIQFANRHHLKHVNTKNYILHLQN